MEYREFPAPPELARLVRCCWTLDGHASDAPADPVFPDGSPEIICNIGDPIDAARADGAFSHQPALMLVGQLTAPFVVQPTGTVLLFGFRLEPFGGAPFCDDMSSITDSWFDLAASARIVVEHSPVSTENPYTRSQALEDVGRQLTGKLRPFSDNSAVPHAHVIAACRVIREQRGNLNVDELASSLGTTTRSLQRRFAAEVGIPPKLLARIIRFQQVFSAWREDPRTLAAVAADCGYFDQSHLVLDFRDFAGEAPASALAEQAMFTSFFLP